MAEKTARKSRTDSLFKNIESAISHMDSGKIIIVVHKKKIVQVEFLEKNWSDDVWAIGGGI